jgi:hypothetical protein
MPSTSTPFPAPHFHAHTSSKQRRQHRLPLHTTKTIREVVGRRRLNQQDHMRARMDGQHVGYAKQVPADETSWYAPLDNFGDIALLAKKR